MDISFVGQPFDDECNLHDFLDAVLGGTDFTHLSIATAWAKRSGLGRVAPELRAFDGTKLIIVGVDEGGATRQGLELAMELFDDAYVLHDRRGSTFHPKLYLARSAERARVFLGSNNLTAGGLYFNYETAVEIELDLTRPQDAALLERIEGYLDRLLADDAVCKDLTPALLEGLERTAGIRLGDEDTRRRATPAEAPEDTDSETEEVGGDEAPLFGSSAQGRRSDPRSPAREAARPAKRTLEGRVAREAAAPAITTEPAAPPLAPSPAPALAVRRWTKRMRNTDAQHPLTGNPTGNLRLTQAGHDIDWQRWFRYDLFGNETWTADTDSRGNPIEKAEVEFNVTVDGVYHGRHTLVVDHAPHRQAGQANVPSILHWGDAMGALLRQRDYTDYYLVIERLSDGTYRLEISPTEPVPRGIT